MNRTDITKIWLTQDAIWIETTDGRKAAECFNDYAGLKNANQNQRENYSISFFGIHWRDIDEDLSFDGFFNKKIPYSKTPGTNSVM